MTAPIVITLTHETNHWSWVTRIATSVFTTLGLYAGVLSSMIVWAIGNGLDVTPNAPRHTRISWINRNDIATIIVWSM